MNRNLKTFHKSTIVCVVILVLMYYFYTNDRMGKSGLQMIPRASQTNNSGTSTDKDASKESDMRVTTMPQADTDDATRIRSSKEDPNMPEHCNETWSCPHGSKISISTTRPNMLTLQTAQPLRQAVGQFNRLLDCLNEELLKCATEECSTISSTLKCMGCKLPTSGESSCSALRYSSRFGQVDHAISPRVAVLDKDNNYTRDEYFQAVNAMPNVMTLYLDWQPTGKAFREDVLIDQYYRIRNVTQLCKMESIKENKKIYPKHIIPCPNCSNECEENLNVLNEPSDVLDMLPKLQEYPLYLHIIQNGTVNELGHVKVGRSVIIPFRCKIVDVPTDTPVHYKLVFVMSQQFGGAYYHANIETMPRLAPYLEFLKQHPEVKIHAQGRFVARNFPLLGLTPDRLVSGDVTADVVYVPQGVGCGQMHPIGGQLLHSHYAHFITTNSSDTVKADTIILIQRHRRRTLGQHAEVLPMLQAIAKQKHMRFELFGERPIPTFEETVRMFSRARLVVGPHGAGLSNLIYSRPGTRVIQTLCQSPVLCYRTMHNLLGQPYVGLLSLHAPQCGPMKVDLDYLKMAILAFLK